MFDVNGKRKKSQQVFKKSVSADFTNRNGIEIDQDKAHQDYSGICFNWNYNDKTLDLESLNYIQFI
jgi:hypothetical protein